MSEQELIDYMNKHWMYVEDTGYFVWKVNKGRNRFGRRVGTTNEDKYIKTSLGNKQYSIHRLIWLYKYGVFPKNIDHINGIKSDNRLCNLREVSHQDNMKNRKIPKHNTSGFVGVNWHKESKKWIAQIGHNGKQIVIGFYKELEDAIEARKKANIEYGYHINHGRQ